MAEIDRFILKKPIKYKIHVECQGFCPNRVPSGARTNYVRRDLLFPEERKRFIEDMTTEEHKEMLPNALKYWKTECNNFCRELALNVKGDPLQPCNTMSCHVVNAQFDPIKTGQLNG